MNKSRFILNALSFVIVTLFAGAVVNAQATRTWVSGVGDDVNPCSRTAPCKTFAGAISKTAIAGEINALDPAGYGVVTINKSITIDGGGVLASILASGVGAGVIVNVPVSNATDPERRVVLRHLTINGTGSCGANCGTSTGLRGINVLQVGELDVENCFIQNFITVGIDATVDQSTTFLSVKDTNFNNTGDAMQMSTTFNGGFIAGTLDNVRVDNCRNGILAKDRAFVAIRNSVLQSVGAAGSIGIGIQAPSNIAGLVIENTFVFNWGTAVAGGGAGTSVDLSNTSIMNSFTGISSGGGVVRSDGNNRIANNSSAGVAPTNVGQQ